MSSPGETCSGLSALVADDDPIARRLLRAFLERMDFEVTEAADGQELLTECEKAKPTIIVTDIQMPNMDGFAACVEIRKIYSAAELPILAISGWFDEQTLGRAAEIGITDCLAKPLQRASFEDHVNAALKQAASEQR